MNTKTVQNIIPAYPKPRVRCPFYGFSLPKLCILKDSKGNQCHHCGDHAPCRMEMDNEIPDWDKCPISKTPEAINGLGYYKEKVTIFPEEFCPEDDLFWKGLSFGQWMDYVLGDTVERPPPTKTIASNNPAPTQEDGSDLYVALEEEGDTTG